ncbi:MAG: 30S ribosomal protein S12 methylthiotransferase RimO, partial [Clostridia bacterium]|nr:30S ribosomal protein S12 methylthiotransferase RimO [Clostridia bacterium]
VEYLKLFETLRKNIPEIAIRSTFITGFPMETEEEVENLCGFLREAQLENCGFFAYSREPDTAAYKLKGQLSYAEKHKRVKKLYAVQRQISADKLKKRVGTTLKVLCDGIDYDKNCFVGRAYFSAPDIDGKVYFNAGNAVQGEYYNVKIEKSDSYDLYGKTEDFEL